MPFFWTAGHLGWGLFAILVFSGIALPVVDLIWRLTKTPARRLLGYAVAGWMIGVALIVLAFLPGHA